MTDIPPRNNAGKTPTITTTWQPSASELAQIQQQWSKYLNGNQQYVNYAGDNYKVAYPYPGRTPINEQWRANERQFSYWEYPQRVVRYHDMIRTAAPEWKAPEWLNVDKVNEAYEYLKYRNNGAPTQEWKALPEDDAGTQMLRSMGRPPIQFLMPTEIEYKDLVKPQDQVDAQKPIDWSQLDQPGMKWMKLYLGMFSPQAEGITNRPTINRLAASVAQSFLPSLGVGAALGAVTLNPLVGAIGTVAATGLLTYQNFTGNQIPGFNAIMRPFNWMAEGAESAIGNIALGSKVGLGEILDDPEAAYRAGLLNYETMKMSNIPNWFAKTADLFNPMDVTTADKDEIWKISQGILTPVKAPHGKGTEALEYYHGWIESGSANDEFEKAISDGTFTGRYQDFIYQKAISEYGDTAIANDIIFQTIIDPLNVMPWAVGKMGTATAGKIAKTASNPATVRMASTWSEILKQGTGNIMIDALPIGLQQLVSGITKKAPSRGVMDNLNVYRDTIRNYTFPASVRTAGDDIRTQYTKLTKEGIEDIRVLDNTLTWTDKNGVEQSYTGKPSIKIETPKVEDLSPLEKWIGGIDDVYGLKELRPTVGKKFLTKFFSLTPDSQVSHIMTAFHHNIATMMDVAAGDPNRMVELIQQLSGRKTVKPGELGYDMINSPAHKSVMAAMQYAFSDKDIATNMLGSWITGGERRGILDKVARALGEKPADILTQLQDNPDAMAQRLNKIAPQLKTTGKDLTSTLKVFIGDDAMPWSAEQFQANLVNTIATKMDDYFKEKYGLKPESWIFRASNAMKGVQSLVLLGFNPAYFMNNWVNNVVTRAADGIGGYMTNKQVNDFYTRFGIFPKDSGLSMYDDITGAVIRNATEASNDVLSKAQKTITFLNKAGVFSRLSHKIEKLEGGQARVISMNQYLDKTKKVGVGIRKLDPAVEIMLDSKYPGLKERVYNAVNAGLNMKEIESSLFSTEIRPHIENIIDEIEQKYPGARDTLRKTNITDRLRDELANVKTKEDLDIAFENVKNAWDSWVDEQTSRAIINGVDVEAKNLTHAERVPFVLKKFGDMVIDQAKRWLNGRKEWDDLYARWEELDIAGLWDVSVQKLERKQRAEWERARKYEIETHKGIIEAIGIENEHSRAYVNGIGEYHDTWNTYWKERSRLYNEYYGMRRGKDQAYEEFRADKQRAWDKLQEAQEKLYDDATTKEIEIQRRMDAEFAAMYETYTGWDATGAARWRAELWNQRKAIITAQKAMRKQTKGMIPDERATAYKEFNPGYNEMIAKMHQVEHDGAYKLMNKPVPEVKIEVPPAENVPGEPVIRTVDGLLREEGRKTGFSDEQMDQLRPEQVAEAVNKRLRNEENARNTPIGKAKDLVSAKIRAEDIIREADDIKRRETLKQQGKYSRATVGEAFEKAYPMATKAQVEVALTLFDSFIDRWAKRNGYQPGEAARDAYYATRFASIERGDGTVGEGALEKLDQLMQYGDYPLPSKKHKSWNEAIHFGGITLDHQTSPHGKYAIDKVADGYKLTFTDKGKRVIETFKNIGEAEDFAYYHAREFNPGELYQGESPKGSYKLLDDGSAIIKGFQAGDISSMVHEVAHVFRRDLTDADMDVVAQHAGLVNGTELRELEYAFATGQLKEGTPEYAKYVQAEEEFARGWERYLAEGDAPTPQLKSVFRKFTDWMLNIYSKLFKKGMKVEGFEGTPLNVNIDAQYGGGSLRDVFDRMLVDKPNMVDFDSLVSDKLDEVTGRGRNKTRFNENERVKMAQKELISDLFKEFRSEEEARAYVDSMTDYKQYGSKDVDDATMHDALKFIDDNPDMNPWTTREIAKVEGKRTSPDTPNGDEIQMQYKVVELDDLEASDNWMGNTVSPNPNYKQELQGRIRSEKSSVAWMMDKSKPEVFDPKLILKEYNSTDRGTPIITYGNQVWSGNGRVGAVRYSIINELGGYEKYRAALDEYAGQAGIDPATYADMKRPFLVREIMGEVTPEQLETWAADSNKGSSASMTEFEKSINDSNLISDEAVRNLEVGDDESIEGALLAARNQSFITQFLTGLDKESIAEVSDNLKLNDKGVSRIMKALMAKVYKGAAGERLVRIIANGDESLVKNQLKVLKDTLPQVAVIEGKIATKQLDGGLKLSDDLSVAIDMIDRLRSNRVKNQKAHTVQQYLEPDSALFRETTPFQDVLIDFLDTAKQTEARQTIRNYTKIAELEPDPRQPDMFGGTTFRTKEEIWDEAIGIGRTEGEEIDTRLASVAGETTAPTSGLREQPIDTRTGEGTGGVQRGSESLRGLPEQPDFGAIAKQVISTQTKADYDAGKPVPIERAKEIEITHQDTLPIPDDVSEIIKNTDTFKFDKKKQAMEYNDWILNGERGKRPDVSQEVIDFYEPKLNYLREQAAMWARGVTTKKVTPEALQKALDLRKQHKLVIQDRYQEMRAPKVEKGLDSRGEMRYGYEYNPEYFITSDATGMPMRHYIQLEDGTRVHPDELDRIHIGKDGKVQIESEKFTVIEEGQRKNTNNSFESAVFGIPRYKTKADGGGLIAPDKLVTVKTSGGYEITMTMKEWSGIWNNARKLTFNEFIEKYGDQYADKIKKPDSLFDQVDISQNGITPDQQILVDKLNEALVRNKDIPDVYEKLKAKRDDILSGTVYATRDVTAELVGGVGAQIGNLTRATGLVNEIMKRQSRPGINIQKVFRFKHGGTDCIANVYKDGELIAYVPLDGLKDADLPDSTRILGLDPQFPDKWVYEQDGVIKSVDMRKPEVETIPDVIGKKFVSTLSGREFVPAKIEGDRVFDKDGNSIRVTAIKDDSTWVETGNSTGQSSLFQSGQLDMFSDTNTDLPLFSGTPMSADDMGFAPKASSPQMSMFPDIVPEAKPTRIIEIAIKEQGATSYIRLDLKKTKAIRDKLALHKGADMTARILDANGKVVESNLDPQQVITPTMGGNALFQMADNTDTPEFKNWFSWDWKNNKPGNKPSVIVDGNGNPLLVHHGSPHDFNEFDFSNVRENGTSEGVGFYYIDNEDIARGYAKNSSGNGFLYDGYLSITNPMTLTQKKITKSQWKQIIKEIEKTYPEALANYGDYNYYGREKVLNDAINIEFENNDTDLDIIGSFGNGGMADWETINRAVVKVTGYDGVVTEWNNKTTKATVYVTFLPEQFKSTNNAGEYNPRNPNFLKQEGFQEAPGATEQFREYNEPPIDVQRDMDAPMGHVPLNGTPTTEPFAQTLNEIGSDYINPILTDIQSAFKAKMGDKAFSWGDVADADRKTVRQYLNGTVTNDLADVKRAALTYGDTMRNNAMLDYSRRYGFDQYLNLIFPYQFWYTRSMMNWAKRAIDKPSWFAMYARIQQAQERMEREGMPTRLRGKVRFNQAWMPEWMGGGMWTDPMNKIFPFDQFGQPFEQYANNQNQIMKRAESIVDEMRTSEKITSAEAQQALETQSGSVWDRAVSQAEIEMDKSASPLSLATMMMTPALWWTVPYNIARGTPEKISTLPITRTGQTMKELGKDTFLEFGTNIVGGIMAGPETMIRKKAGLSEFGQWGDYYVDRTLAGMAADGEISAEQARIGMVQRSGDAFAEAYRRVSQETALRTPGAAGLMALKQTIKDKKGIGTVAGQTLSGFLTGMFGGSIFSEGEMKMRGLKPEYDNAWRKFEAGDEEAINDFFDNHPEYYARLALYDEPETRLHQFLIDSIWQKYMDLDKENRRLAREALGDEFMNSFMNKETRSYDAISDETLAKWSQTLGKSEMPEQVADVQGEQIDYYDDPMVQAITAYKSEKESMFPNIYMWQEQYFALEPGAQRKAFLQQYPQLKAYWDWKDKYAEQHPDIAPYFDELKQSATADEVTSELTSPLIRQMLTYATGGSLSSGAKTEIERIRQMYAPNMGEDEFLQLIMAIVSP